jgi:hypothetical protein
MSERREADRPLALATTTPMAGLVVQELNSGSMLAASPTNHTAA